jgi:cilia- and flagella-associated protein 251
MDDKENALRLEWTFGFNNKLTNGVHNLASGDRYALFYVSAHSGVIYDTAERTQTLLQGHKVNGRFFVCLFFQWS